MKNPLSCRTHYHKALDFEKNPKTSQLKRKHGSRIKVYNTCLESSITLAVGARIMLTRNISVADGLVNGAFGTNGLRHQFPLK